jgi:hypothetical protein
VESRGLAAVAVLRERAGCNWGADYLGKFFELLFVMAWSITLAFIFQFSCRFIDGEVNVCQQSKQVHLAAIAVGSSRVALVWRHPRCAAARGTLYIIEVMQLAVLFTFIHSHYLIISVFILFFLAASVDSYFFALIKCAHSMLGAVIGARFERFALHVCSLNRVWFLKSLNCFIVICCCL